MKKITSFLMRVMPLGAAIIVLMVGSIAKADYVSCGEEKVAAIGYYPYSYTIPSGFTCYNFPGVVFVYKDCIDQYGNACTISWNEYYDIQYYASAPSNCGVTTDSCCLVSGGFWTSNGNIVNGCQ